MKREAVRDEELRAFDLPLEMTEILWATMRDLFDPSNPVEASIRLDLPHEALQFDSIADLKSYKLIRGRVTRFSLEMRQEDRKLTIKGDGRCSSPATVQARAQKDAWCMGAVDTVKKTLQRNRVWCWWLGTVSLSATLIGVVAGPLLTAWFPPPSPEPISHRLVAAWVVLLALLGFVAVTRDRLLPAAGITFTDDRHWFRRNIGEVGSILGVIGIVLAVIALP